MEDKFFLMQANEGYLPVSMSMYSYFRRYDKSITNPKLKNLTREEAIALCKLLNNGEEAPVWMQNDGA